MRDSVSVRRRSRRQALRHLHQQRVAGGVAVVVVDVLEVVDVEEGERKARRVAQAQEMIGVLLDQLAVRQTGQVVEIGALEQLGFGLLVLGDLDRARQHEPPLGDPYRPVRRQIHPLVDAAADDLLAGLRLSGAHQLDAGIAPLGQRARQALVGAVDQPIDLGVELICRGLIGEHDAAVRIRHRHCRRQHCDHLAQRVEIGKYALLRAGSLRRRNSLLCRKRCRLSHIGPTTMSREIAPTGNIAQAQL